MTLALHLLGPPRIVRDGVPLAGPRGHKAWVLLAYLLDARVPAGREHVAALFFPEAEDPLGALRWNLSELHRLLGPGTWERGKLTLQLPGGSFVDVQVIGAGPRAEALQVPGLGRDYLEGIHLDAAPALAAWLDSERRRYGALGEAILREECLSLLAQGVPRRATELASRLVTMNPLDEAHHTLLVRSLATAGDGIAAARQVAACRKLFRRELGIEPSPALDAAANTSTAHAVARPAMGAAAVRAQIEAGEAAVRAGAADAGIECLRRAVVDADKLGERHPLRASALLALGSALVHAVRGYDEEGAVALHRALGIAEPDGTPLAADVCRELGYVDFLRGRYERATSWLQRALAHAAPESRQHCAILALQGSVYSDVGRHDEARFTLEAAVARAGACGEDRQFAYAQAMLGRVHLLAGDLDRAVAALDAAIAMAGRGWTAFLPWPQSLRAEVDLQRGEIAAAEAAFDGAFALGCQFGDPCWEGVAGRGRARVAAARGHPDAAVDLLKDALGRAGRVPDAYLWGKAYVLDALCGLCTEHRPADLMPYVAQLQRIASRCGMREMLVRAHLHAAAGGLGNSRDSVKLLAGESR